MTTADFLAKPANQTSYQKYIKYVVNLPSTGEVPTELDGGLRHPADHHRFFQSLWLPTREAREHDRGQSARHLAQLIARGIYVDVLDPVYRVGIDTSAVDYLTKEGAVSGHQPDHAGGVGRNHAELVDGQCHRLCRRHQRTVQTVVDPHNYFGSYSRGYDGEDRPRQQPGAAERFCASVTAYQGILASARLLPISPAGSVAAGADGGHAGQNPMWGGRRCQP